MNRETYRRLPVDKSIISLISNRRAVHKVFLRDEKWAFDCAKHFDNSKAVLPRRAELIIQRTTSISMMYDPVFTSVDKFWKVMKNNAHLLRLAGKLFIYADLTDQFKAEPWTLDDLRKYRNLIVENPVYLTKDHQSYLAEVMGLDYALQVDIVTHNMAVELLVYVCEAFKHESWSTRIRVIAHAIVDSPELQTWAAESIPAEWIQQVRVNVD